MSPAIRILAIIASLLFLIATLELVRRGKLREEYSLLFILWSAVALFMALFGGILQRVAAALSTYGASLAFGLTLMMILLILIVQGSILSTLKIQNRLYYPLFPMGFLITTAILRVPFR